MRNCCIKRRDKLSGQINWKNLYLLLLLLLPLIMPAQEVSVAFSSPGGFYEFPFSLSLSCPSGYSIHYTLNGNLPLPSDPVYESPLLLDEKLYSKSNIYTIPTCSDSFWFVPDTIQRCIVIRAAAFDDKGRQLGHVVTHSYFIQSLWPNLSQLPVISLCCDSLDLFDYNQGILVPGAMFDPENPLWSGNYYQHGKEWERLCNIEFYETNNSGVNQQAGLRIHGDFTRKGIQKGFKLYARKEYGEKRFKHQFFETIDIKSFKHLALKPLGIGNIPDHICTQIASSLNFEKSESRPVILFLNGEYWGLYYLKERPDDQFISDHFGYDKEDVNVIESWDGKVANGHNEDFINMMRWFLRADLSNPDEYKHACNLIDIDCFIDYYCFQLFVSNYDWPSNNMRCWQTKGGKWRWIFFDGDACLTSFTNMLANTIINVENMDYSALVFTKLLMNEDFRDCFYERFGHLLTHEFDYKHTKEYFSSCMTDIETESDSHFARFSTMGQKEGFISIAHDYDEFLSIRMVGAAAMVYQFYCINNWRYNNSKARSQKTFKYDKNDKSNIKPTFLLRMALQFRDWRYVNRYYNYLHFLKQKGDDPSTIHRYLKKTKIWKWLKSLK